jgi:hypothetical protein
VLQILGPLFDCISRFLAEGQTSKTACGRALCPTLEVDAGLGMGLGKISKPGPGILVPLRGIRAFERDTVASLVGLVRRFWSCLTYGR